MTGPAAPVRPLSDEEAEIAATLPAIPGGWAAGDVAVADRSFVLLLPADPDAVLDEPGLIDRCRRTGEDPYWCTLWPAAATLAGRALADPPAAGTRVLELGCGSALAGLAASAAGAVVTATDNHPRAVALAAANARVNGVPMTAAPLDWREPDGPRFPRILGADLLYRVDLHAALLAALEARLEPGGTALLSDPGRASARDFFRAAGDAGWRVRLTDADGGPLTVPRVPGHQFLELTRS